MGQCGQSTGVACGRLPVAAPVRASFRGQNENRWSSMIRLAATSRRGRSTSGGTGLPIVVRKVPVRGSWNRSTPSRASSCTRVRKSIARKALGWRPSARARRRSLRRMSAWPQRSGAGSVNALNRGRPVWKGPWVSGSSGSMPKAPRWDSQDGSYSNDAVSRAPRMRVQSLPTGTGAPSRSMTTSTSRSMTGVRPRRARGANAARKAFLLE